MKFPVALVTAVLVWSSARYLPPYFLELRKLDLTEQQMQLDTAKQMAVLKELRAHIQSQTKTSSEPTSQPKRFY